MVPSVLGNRFMHRMEPGLSGRGGAFPTGPFSFVTNLESIRQ